MVVIRDTPPIVTTHHPSTNANVGPVGISAAQLSGSSSSNSTTSAALAPAPASADLQLSGEPPKVTRTRYPEIRYVFSDDDFTPTVDVLDDTTNTDAAPRGATGSSIEDNNDSSPVSADDEEFASVVLDFDATGTKIVAAASLSAGWQVMGVSMKQQQGLTNAATGSGGGMAAGSVPAWAELADEARDCVAHVVYIDGASSKPATQANQTKKQQQQAQGQQGGNVEALIKQFQAKNEMLRKILSASNGTAGDQV